MSVKSTRMVNELTDILLGSPVVSGVVASGFYTAIVIVIIITLLASFVYRDSEDKFRKALRLLFWATVFTSAVFMLRDRYVSNAAASTRVDVATTEMFSPSGARTGGPTGSYMTPTGAYMHAGAPMGTPMSTPMGAPVYTGSSGYTNAPVVAPPMDAFSSQYTGAPPRVSDEKLSALVAARGYDMVPRGAM